MIKGLEALEEISLLVDVRKEHINKYLNIIEQELEINEILKTIIKSCFVFNEHGVEVKNITVSKNIEEKIKEWLERC